MPYVFTAEQKCFYELAKQTWRRKQQAKQHGLPYGEETITETFLLDLADRYPGRITIVPFTKPAEGKFGSDWAWSFQNADRSGSYSMMVQAKALSKDQRNYPEISRFIGESAVRQIDRLVETSKRLGFPAYYAFYNFVDDLSRLPKSCRSLEMLGSANDAEAWGISISSAAKVRDTLPDQSFDSHCANSMPLHCLLCSSGTGAKSQFGTPGNIYSRLTNSISQDFKSSPIEIRGFSQIVHPIFAAAETAKQEFQPGLIETLRNEYPGVDGVVIFRDIDA
jgi:hypothetical protein